MLPEVLHVTEQQSSDRESRHGVLVGRGQPFALQAIRKFAGTQPRVRSTLGHFPYQQRAPLHFISHLRGHPIGRRFRMSRPADAMTPSI